MQNKVMQPREAVEKFVQSGRQVSLGGFTIVRNPTGLVHEIIRQNTRNLHLCVHSQGPAVDLLIGAGCVQSIELAYVANARFSPSGSPAFRRAVEQGRIRYEDYSNHMMVCRFAAGALGIPFFPLKGMPDTDVFRKWGFDDAFRCEDPRLPARKLATVRNPFGRPGEEEEIIVVPALHPDVTLLHVQKAGVDGTVRIDGLRFADVEQAKAAKRVVVSCEEVLSLKEVRRDSDRNDIPFFIVDAVVPLPYGGHPTACYRYYDYDGEHLALYGDMAETDGGFDEYLNRFVLESDSHEDYLARIGADQLESIKADPVLGFRPRMSRT